MITFTKDQNRLINFNQAKLNLDNLELFDAVNAIDHYSHFESIDRKNNYHANQYIDKWKWLPGKLGCNLSYVKLLKDYHRNYNFYPNFPSWLLVIEDDVEIKIEDATSVFSSILNKASDLSFDFVKFFITTGKENINGKIIEFSPELQFDESRHISDGFYKLMPSWGTVAQAFHINSVSKILKQLPWNDHIDQILMRPPVFDSLNGAAYKQDFLNYCGAKSLEDSDSEYGSLIFNNSTDGKVNWEKLTRV
jgi:GR25 family glycosyltransferase involved in LPS biosynthesis